MKRMIALGLICLLLAGCAATPAPTEALPTEPPVMVDPVDDNCRTYYQIFVGSFSDSNRDGIGDLRGIINRMDYLNDGNILSGDDLGIQGIWLCMAGEWVLRSILFIIRYCGKAWLKKKNVIEAEEANG